jgi:SAM-dependent methyltransferase
MRPVHPPLTLQGWLRYDVVQRLLARLPEVRSVLEVGAGGGALGARLARRYDYTAVEPDPESFALASARVPGRVLHELPPRGTYDLVCAFEVLEHLDDDEAALRDWVRHVVPGGHVLVSVPAWPRLLGESDRRVGHRRRYTPEALRSLAAAAGLEVVELRLYAFPAGHALHAVRDVVARVRPPAGSGGSGRWLQPPDRLGALTFLAALPLRGLQRLFPWRGSGLVLLARRTSDQQS